METLILDLFSFASFPVAILSDEGFNVISSYMIERTALNSGNVQKTLTLLHLMVTAVGTQWYKSYQQIVKLTSSLLHFNAKLSNVYNLK